MARLHRRQLSRVVYESNLDRADAMLDNLAARRVFAAGNIFRNAVLMKLTGARKGRTYKVPGTKRTYTASAPGEPPALRIGALRQSVKMLMIRALDGGYASVVGTDKLYGKALDQPKKYPERKRPFFESTYNEVKEQCRKAMRGER